MGDFNAGLRIEVENDLYREEGAAAAVAAAVVATDEVELLRKNQMGNPPSPASFAEESDKEDGELSGPEEMMDNSGGDDAMAMEVDGVDEGNDGDGSKLSADGSHDSEARMPRSSADDKMYRPRTYPNPFLNDVLVSEEKLNSRAARFGISSNSQGNAATPRVQLPLPSDQEVLDLYVLLGLIEDDGGEPTLDKVGNQYRLNSILIRGTNQMSTQDIFAYLRDNNQRPLNMEWVNDACCIVNYKDKYEAARSVLGITKPIVVEPRPERKEKDDGGLEPDDEMSEDFDYHAAVTVSSRRVTVPMPPGHTWRFAVPCAQAKGILMRYATTQDKKQEKSERHSEYYKKFGNPNYQGLGIVTASFRNRLQKKKSKELPEDLPEPVEEAPPVSNRLAWAQLSQRWNDEELAAAQQRAKSIKPKSSPAHGPRPQSGTFQGPRRPRNESPNANVHPKKNLKVRVDFEDRGAGIKSRLKRRREPAEDEEEKDEDDDESESDDEETKWSKKLKGPRMKMHADEEEQKMKDRMRRHGGGGQGGNRGRGGNVHSRLSNRLSWPGVYRRRDVQDEDAY